MTRQQKDEDTERNKTLEVETSTEEDQEDTEVIDGRRIEDSRPEESRVPETGEFDEEFEAAEIERLFGPVDDKHQDVEQV